MLGERLIDVIGVVAAMGFAAEVAHCLYLCSETWRKGDKGATNDMLARSMEKQGWAALLREAQAKVRDASRMTQLICAARAEDLPRVMQLVQLGAPLEIKDRTFGFLPLGWACYSDFADIVEVLLEGGANVMRRAARTTGRRWCGPAQPATRTL